eukprot:3270030-Rhodomonas_salina.2
MRASTQTDSETRIEGERKKEQTSAAGGGGAFFGGGAAASSSSSNAAATTKASIVPAKISIMPANGTTASIRGHRPAAGRFGFAVGFFPPKENMPFIFHNLPPKARGGEQKSTPVPSDPRPLRENEEWRKRKEGVKPEASGDREVMRGSRIFQFMPNFPQKVTNGLLKVHTYKTKI